MALLALSDDALGVIFEGLRNTLDPRVFVDLSSASKGLRVLTQALLQKLRADHEAAVALCFKVGLQSCKELRETKKVFWFADSEESLLKDTAESCATYSRSQLAYLSADDLGLLGTLGSVLPALEALIIRRCLADDSAFTSGPVPDGVQRLAERLGVGALPAVTKLMLDYLHVCDAGASALAAALGRGALPRLEILSLAGTGIGDAGLVALAPALRRLPALEALGLFNNPLGDEGLAALVAPPPPAGALPPPAGGLKKLHTLHLNHTQITDAGCAALAAALDSGALPALKVLKLDGIPASAAAKEAVHAALVLARSKPVEHAVERESCWCCTLQSSWCVLS